MIIQKIRDLSGLVHLPSRVCSIACSPKLLTLARNAGWMFGNLVLQVVTRLAFYATWNSIATKQVAGLVVVVSIVDQTLAVFVAKRANVSCRGRKRMGNSRASAKLTRIRP